MTTSTIKKNGGYSKKQLIDIIEKIDADQHYARTQTEMQKTIKEDEYSRPTLVLDQVNK